MPRFLHALSLLLFLAICRNANAKFVVIANTTDTAVPLTFRHGDQPLVKTTLEAKETRVFPVGRKSELIATVAGGAGRYKLDPYTAYVFVKLDSGLAFQGIEWKGTMPGVQDVPDAPAPATVYRLKVAICVDNFDSRAQPAWEKALRARVNEASAILERQCNLKLEVVAAKTWTGDPTLIGMHALLHEFSSEVEPTPAVVALGFTSNPSSDKVGEDDPPSASSLPPLGCSQGPLSSHILLRAGLPRTEPERVELLVHELAHIFGAAHSPDPASSLRPNLNDGQATSKKFRIGIDPLNLLAMAIWMEEIRTNKVKQWSDLSPAAKARLKVIYGTLQHVLPDDPTAADYLRKLEAIVVAQADDPRREGANSEVAQPRAAETETPEAELRTEPLTQRQQAIREVVRGVVLRATTFSRKRRSGESVPRGDALTQEYIRFAAAIADDLNEADKVPAFLIGLGIALDDSAILRDNPILSKLCHAVESDRERRERLALLGIPTIHDRRDLCQHFVISLALTEMVGDKMALSLGLAKEMLDMDRSSGFSFADLAADTAGVELGRRLHADSGLLSTVKTRFTIGGFVPAVTNLREGLSAKRFQTDFGSSSDPRFEAVIADIRTRIDSLPAYRK